MRAVGRSLPALSFRHPLFLAATLAAIPFGCASTPGSPAQVGSRADPALGRLLADAVLVLPVHEATFELGSAPLSRDSVTALRIRFDTELQQALGSRVTGAWTWPDELRALRRRNPIHVPDPMTLATSDLRGRRLAPEEQVSAQLGSDIRALLALGDARRYVLLPLHLHAGPTSRGGYVAGVTLVIIDARRATILQVRPLALGDVPTDGRAEPPASIAVAPVLQRLAELARIEFTGPDDR